jgi:antitoxin (DNA-binding transcriptional repressor) of toxin-antitoxin stability system
MDEDFESVAVEDVPALAAIVERVSATGVPCNVTRDGRTVAQVVPGRRPLPSLHPHGWKPDLAAAKRAAGAWENLSIDAEKMIEDIYHWRETAPVKPSILL